MPVHEYLFGSNIKPQDKLDIDMLVGIIAREVHAEMQEQAEKAEKLRSGAIFDE